MTRRTTRSTSKVIFVKVAKTGGTVTEVALNGDTGHSVEAALDAVGLEFQTGQRIRVGGRPADMETILKDKDVVTLSGSVKGGN